MRYTGAICRIFWEILDRRDASYWNC